MVVASSGTFLTGGGAVLPRAYTHLLRSAWRYDVLPGSLPVSPIALTAERDDITRELTVRGDIVAAELWGALRGGGWLAVRRPPLLDTFVQAGVCLIVRRGQEAAVHEIAATVGSDLAAALGRRARYFVRFRAEGPEPTAEVIDAGRRDLTLMSGFWR